MGDVEVFGSGDYAMRLWLDPAKIAARNMDVDEVLAAVEYAPINHSEISERRSLHRCSTNCRFC